MSKRRKRAEYCFESTVSEKRTHWASLSFGVNSVSSANKNRSVRFGTQIIGWEELTEFALRNSVSPQKTHWVRCSKPYSARFRKRHVQSFFFGGGGGGASWKFQLKNRFWNLCFASLWLWFSRCFSSIVLIIAMNTVHWQEVTRSDKRHDYQYCRVIRSTLNISFTVDLLLYSYHSIFQAAKKTWNTIIKRTIPRLKKFLAAHTVRRLWVTRDVFARYLFCCVCVCVCVCVYVYVCMCVCVCARACFVFRGGWANFCTYSPCKCLPALPNKERTSFGKSVVCRIGFPERSRRLWLSEIPCWKGFQLISTLLEERRSPIFWQHDMLSLPRFGHFRQGMRLLENGSRLGTNLDVLFRDHHSLLEFLWALSYERPVLTLHQQVANPDGPYFFDFLTWQSPETSN